MSSLHLKQCVQRFGVFDFLRDIVSKVPDIGSSDAGGEDKSAKKRKSMEEESNGNEDTKRNKTEMMTGHGHSGRGHGRGRGRGRGRGTHADRDTYDKCEDSADISPQHKTEPHALNSDQLADCLDATELKETIVCGTSGPALVHNFDLNVDPDETGDTRGCPATGSAVVPASDIKLEEYPGWSLPEMGKMPFDPSRFPLSSRHLDEDDYDNEDD